MAHFKIKLGMTKTLSSTWYTTAAKTTIKDLTGWTGRIQFRPESGSSIVLLDLHTGNGGMVITVGQVEENLKIVIDDSDLTNVPPGRAVWNMMLIDNVSEPHHHVGTAEFIKTFTPATIPA